jgi:hypothetical protein
MSLDDVDHEHLTSSCRHGGAFVRGIAPARTSGTADVGFTLRAEGGERGER